MTPGRRAKSDDGGLRRRVSDLVSPRTSSVAKAKGRVRIQSHWTGAKGKGASSGRLRDPREHAIRHRYRAHGELGAHTRDGWPTRIATASERRRSFENVTGENGSARGKTYVGSPEKGGCWSVNEDRRRSQLAASSEPERRRL
jgi:hypothetical protein